MNDRWIIVPNWDKFQHYKDRVPVWIKVHLEILDKPETEALTDAELGLLVRIWCLTARTNGVLNVEKVTQQRRNRHLTAALESLSDAGLVRVVASKPLAQRREEERREEEGPASKPNSNTRRENAGAYHKHTIEPLPDRLPLELLESYALKLKNRPTVQSE
jgi:hypothetical protein